MLARSRLLGNQVRLLPPDHRRSLTSIGKNKSIALSCFVAVFQRERFDLRLRARRAVSHEPMSYLQSSESDHSQPHDRPRFAPKTQVQTALMSMTARQGRSHGEWFESFVSCNLRTRRVLQLNDLYRGFECLPLRHAVCPAEKSACITLEIA